MPHSFSGSSGVPTPPAADAPSSIHVMCHLRADTAAKAVCAADAGRSPCDTAFSTSLRDLNLDFAAVFADSAGTVGMVKVAAGRPESFGDLGFPAEYNGFGFDIILDPFPTHH